MTVWKVKTLIDLDHADDLNVLHKNVSTMSEFLDVLKVFGRGKGLEINVKKIKPLRLGINKSEDLILGN